MPICILKRFKKLKQRSSPFSPQDGRDKMQIRTWHANLKRPFRSEEDDRQNRPMGSKERRAGNNVKPLPAELNHSKLIPEKDTNFPQF